MTKELSGKTAFVTGSGRGLGRAMAEKSGRARRRRRDPRLDWTAPAKYGEAADLDAVAKEIARHGGKVCAVSGNIGDKAAVAAMKRTIDAEARAACTSWSIAPAATSARRAASRTRTTRSTSPFEDIKVLTENNLIGTMLVCQAFVPAMKAAGSGSVVNIASVAAHMGCSPEVVYSTLKAGVVHYTRCLAKELLEDGVRVNAVSPGADQDRALPGDPRRRSEADGRRAKVAQPLRRARRDRRRGRVPRGPARQVHQRPGAARRRRAVAVRGLAAPKLRYFTRASSHAKRSRVTSSRLVSLSVSWRASG